MRTLAVLTVLVLLGVAATSQDHPTREIGTGLALVGSNYQQKPPGEALAGAWSEAWDFAQRNPDALGFPWMDPRTNELVLAVANPAGAALARQWAPLRDEARGVPRRVRNVRYSFAELIQIQHGSIGRDSGLPEGDGIIWMTAPDFAHNRIVITVDHLSAALLQALASRYGTEAIAIHVEPRRGYFGY